MPSPTSYEVASHSAFYSPVQIVLGVCILSRSVHQNNQTTRPRCLNECGKRGGGSPFTRGKTAISREKMY